MRTQSNTNFKVSFVDYGTEAMLSKEIADLVNGYSFTSYQYYHTQFQPWNKCKALNSVIKQLDDGYVFVADVDMIFHPEFVETAVSLQETKTVVYFKVGFLSEEETKKNLPFAEYKIKFFSEVGATGLSMFPVKPLKQLRGFDEFYHFWGSEDTDAHVRMRNSGATIQFYDETVLMLHQHHLIYRNKEKSTLTKELQLSGIVQLNAQYLKNAIDTKRTKVNEEGWAMLPSEEEIWKLNSLSPRLLTSKTSEIDAFLFTELPRLTQGDHAFLIKENEKPAGLKKKAKSLISGKTNREYTLKEVNDKLLLHLISFYHNQPYTYRISDKLDAIDFRISIR